uniref:Uncharacterized protein n=1 Tax=Romanomermis culicivorax TaxID=13658 RepID=A0A915K0Y1_ROMCU
MGLKAHLYLLFPTERNGTECNQRNVTEWKGNSVGGYCRSFSVKLQLYFPFRPKADFQAKRFKLLTIHSVGKSKV